MNKTNHVFGTKSKSIKATFLANFDSFSVTVILLYRNQRKRLIVEFQSLRLSYPILDVYSLGKLGKPIRYENECNLDLKGEENVLWEL